MRRALEYSGASLVPLPFLSSRIVNCQAFLQMTMLPVGGQPRIIYLRRVISAHKHKLAKCICMRRFHSPGMYYTCISAALIVPSGAREGRAHTRFSRLLLQPELFRKDPYFRFGTGGESTVYVCVQKRRSRERYTL